MIQNFFKLLTNAYTDHERAAKLISPDSTILDFGCGDCSFFDELKKKIPNLKCMGFEIDQKKIAISENKGYEVLTKEEELSSINTRFDWIILNEVIEHLYKEDLQNLFKISSKLLKQSGKILISTPNPYDIFTLSGFWDASDHVRPYTPISIQEAASKYGFKTAKTIFHHLRIHPGKLLFSILTNTSPFAGFTLILEKKDSILQ